MKRSPIEHKLIHELRRSLPATATLMDYASCSSVAIFEPNAGYLLARPIEDESGCDVYGDGDECWTLYHEVRLESYRIDFLLSLDYGWLAIECDGHDFHEKTKQQAAYDKSRDRELLIRGLSTMRFTGSEITHSASRCVADIVACARMLNRRGFALIQSKCHENGEPWARSS